jgi:hypothetical protein
MKAPRIKADRVWGYWNYIYYIPQPRWAGFPFRYNKKTALMGEPSESFSLSGRNE